MTEEYEDLTGAPEEEREHVEEEVIVTEEEKEIEESPQDKNWREMRESLKELKKQNEELNTRLHQKDQQDAYQQWQQMNTANQKAQPPEEEDDVDEEDLITKKTAAKLARQEVEKYIKQKEQQNIPQMLQQQYGDYIETVNQENIQRLLKDDIETARDIESLQDDPVKMSRLLYKTLKAKYGHENQKEDPFFMAKKQQSEERMKKSPISSSAVPKRSALAEANSFANGLTPELKKQLLKEMDEASRYH